MRREMRDLRVDEAAAVLCVSPATLRAWEQRFGYPHSVFGAAGQRRYARGEVIALRDRLEDGLPVASAINTARAVGTDSKLPTCASATPARGQETGGSSLSDARPVASSLDSPVMVARDGLV